MFWLMSLTQAWSDETATTDSTVEQQQYIDHSEVLTALRQNNAKVALKLSDALRDSIACPQRVPLNDQLAMLWVHRGYAYQLLGKDDQVQLSWEQAFSMSPEVQLDPALLEKLSEADQENLLNRFEQLRRLVEAQGVMDPQIPEQIGQAKIFINGRTLSTGQGLKPGEHLAQIVCPEDSLQSRWTTFEEPLDWFAMCPNGVDISAGEAEEDLFDGLFGPSKENTAQYYNPEPICEAGGFSLPNLSLPSVTLPSMEPQVLMTMGGGMSLVLAGVGSYYTWVTPAFKDVLEARERVETQSINQAEAKQISRKFNTARYATIGLLAAGTGLTGYGVVLSVQQVSMAPTWIPGWFGINGQF